MAQGRKGTMAQWRNGATAQRNGEFSLANVLPVPAYQIQSFREVSIVWQRPRQ